MENYIGTKVFNDVEKLNGVVICQNSEKQTIDILYENNIVQTIKL